MRVVLVVIRFVKMVRCLGVLVIRLRRVWCLTLRRPLKCRLECAVVVVDRKGDLLGSSPPLPYGAVLGNPYVGSLDCCFDSSFEHVVWIVRLVKVVSKPGRVLVTLRVR